MVAGDRGLLAMDESNPTCNKRIAKGDVIRLRLGDIVPADARLLHRPPAPPLNIKLKRRL
jgi:hypothetical protein